jgi:hypothetical protein
LSISARLTMMHYTGIFLLLDPLKRFGCTICLFIEKYTIDTKYYPICVVVKDYAVSAMQGHRENMKDAVSNLPAFV